MSEMATKELNQSKFEAALPDGKEFERKCGVHIDLRRTNSGDPNPMLQRVRNGRFVERYPGGCVGG